MSGSGLSGHADVARGDYPVARSGNAVNGGGPDMTERVNRLLEIGVVGYIVISVTQVLMAGSATAPQWLAGVMR